MKQGKHSRPAKKPTPKTRTARRTKKESIDIKSNSANPKMLPITRIICALQLLIMLAGLTYAAFLHLISLKFLIILAVLIFLVTVIHILLIETKSKRIVLKVISIVLSVVVSAVTVYGSLIVGTVDNSLDNLQIDDDKTVVTPKADVTNQPFIVYLSGLDTRNVESIAEKGLSDVNMLVAINPTTKKVLMVNIPRDYYVALDGDSKKMDKLTHAGSKGIGCSMATVENIFGVKCNYYVKVNFKSVVDIVDALGGITVNSEFNFSSEHSLSGKTYSFKVGENALKGDAALAFARERKSFPKGDRQRGIHQQVVIKAIFNKVISPAILNPAKLNGVLTAITSNMKTNISSDDIKKLVRMQQNDMASWDIQSIAVDGKGASMPSYVAGGQMLSVMIPNGDTIISAKQQIDAIFNPDAAASEAPTQE